MNERIFKSMTFSGISGIISGIIIIIVGITTGILVIVGGTKVLRDRKGLTF